MLAGRPYPGINAKLCLEISRVTSSLCLCTPDFSYKHPPVTDFWAFWTGMSQDKLLSYKVIEVWDFAVIGLELDKSTHPRVTRERLVACHST